jgi:putative transposase
LKEFEEHYHAERNHQGLANRIIAPGSEIGQIHGSDRRRERLGGMLNYLYRGTA